jgi:hypothetical protein
MLSKFAAVKISGACRLVMSRVLLGGDGWESAGKSDKSMERLGEWRFDLEVGDGEWLLDDGGVETSIAIAAILQTVALVT